MNQTGGEHSWTISFPRQGTKPNSHQVDPTCATDRKWLYTLYPILLYITLVIRVLSYQSLFVKKHCVFSIFGMTSLSSRFCWSEIFTNRHCRALQHCCCSLRCVVASAASGSANWQPKRPAETGVFDQLRKGFAPVNSRGRHVTFALNNKKKCWILGGSKERHICQSGWCLVRNYESQFYPHSLWIVPHKTVRDYDRAISMGRNRAIYLEMVYEGERFIWHSYVMMIWERAWCYDSFGFCWMLINCTTRDQHVSKLLVPGGPLKEDWGYF